MDQSQGGFALVFDCSFAFIFSQGTLDAMGVNLAKAVMFSIFILLFEYLKQLTLDFQ